MEKIQIEVVKNVTTKKKYVKPEIEFFDVEFESPLLSASVDASTTSRFRTISRDTNAW